MKRRSVFVAVTLLVLTGGAVAILWDDFRSPVEPEKTPPSTKPPAITLSPATPPDESTIEAWARAGFKNYLTGQYSRSGLPTFFQAGPVTEAAIAGLPPILVPFAIEIEPEITNEAFKRLIRLNNLAVLAAGRKSVTDERLASLAEAGMLHALFPGVADGFSPRALDAKGERPATDADIAELRLTETQITDAGVRHLRGLKNLRHLELYNIHIDETDKRGITDAGLEDIAKLEKLTHLNLGCSGVTDAGFGHLSGLKNLTELNLIRTWVSDEGMEHLAALTNLTSLDLGGAQVDAGLKHLSGMKVLARLNLNGTHVTGVGLEHVGKLNSLTHLHLYSTGVTDADLKHLVACKQLGFCDLTSTKVSRKGVTVLGKALPNCDIRFIDTAP